MRVQINPALRLGRVSFDEYEAVPGETLDIRKASFEKHKDWNWHGTTILIPVEEDSGIVTDEEGTAPDEGEDERED